MAGRIREDDIAEVREKARIDDVVSQYVTLRNAGGGSMKGLCPFHDEKSPSFHVTPARGFFHCFGCQEGGDVISFLMKIDGLGFNEAIERLADKYGVQLRRVDGEELERPKGPKRSRLVEAHNKAQEWYADQLATPDALTARQFLDSRGFDQEAALKFGVGFAPREEAALYKHLRQLAFSDEELVTGGLVRHGRGHYDNFQGRLLWPIRDSSGDTIGFGARRIFDDDRREAKYLNTAETPIYKKSQVLYGIDLARREIARKSQAVVVEGYTDVMACHLSGVGTAVATCGTSFGDEHARVLRRFLHDDKEQQSEVIFTFDGDAAGMKAAERAFGLEGAFVSQTYVAIEPTGLDPCDLRLQKGEAEVRELVARRAPIYRFVLGHVVSRFDLSRADGRQRAIRAAAELATSIRDASQIDDFARELSRLVGDSGTQPMPGEMHFGEREILTEVRQAAERGRRERGRRVSSPEPTSARPDVPSLLDPRFSHERETLKLLIQFPGAVGSVGDAVGVNDFTHPVYRSVWEAIVGSGGPAAGVTDGGWAAKLRGQASDPEVAAAISALGVEPVRTAKEPDAAYVSAHIYRLQELTALRRIAAVKSKLQRTNPVEETAVYNKMFGELVALEQHRRTLRELSMGTQ